MTQTNPQEITATSTEQHEEKIVTTLKNGKLVAHVYGHEQMIDEASIVAADAKAAVAKWDEHKPMFRSIARRIINTIEQKSIAVRAILFQGTENVVEVCPSDKKKLLSQDLINEVKFRNAEHLIQDNAEVMLTGSLAQWALANLPILAKPDVLDKNMFVARKILLTDAFRDLYKQVMNDSEASEDSKAFYQRLFEGGYNTPAVEAKK